MPRGGPRERTPGANYSNRTDLNLTNQTYGVASEQAQVAASTPTQQRPTAPPTRPEGVPKPGALGDLFGPTTRPDEPVTAGAPLGPGPGPEALGILGEQAIKAGDYTALRAWLPVLNFMAGRRATPSGAEFIRQLRLSAPAGQ